MSRGRLTPATLATVLRSAHGSSPTTNARSCSPRWPQKTGSTNPRPGGAYAEAAATIGGDYERHRVLSAAVNPKASPRIPSSASIQSARGVKSDYERASLLVEIAGQYNLAGALPATPTSTPPARFTPSTSGSGRRRRWWSGEGR